ncbi:MAG TPA: H(+)/Cl(-) exchange transporter ClcA [Rariglobus sp.]|jgi:CIC family chloride channel protein|nr:H(+)/Cl(-) exchange transporter ClcA [Rariglobus sp.]
MTPSQEAGSGLRTAEVKRRHILLKALLVGVAAGVVAAVFRIALTHAENVRMDWLTGLTLPWRIVGGVVVGAIGSGLGLWLVRRFAPETAGSGIPHLKAVVMAQEELRWARVIPIKFMAGLLGIGGGLALGREGPTVQMGGATGLLVAKVLRVKVGEGERRALISAGAGAGIAAAFNAPLAGVMFVLEELQGNLTPVVFVASFLASVASDVVCRVLTGDAPVFPLPGMVPPGLGVLPWALVLGVLAGGAGVIFNRSLLWSLDTFDRLRRWPVFTVGALAGAVLGLAGVFLPGLTGSGGTLVETALAGGFAVQLIAVWLVLRFLLTMVSYGCGAAGGIFAPLLALGALGGLLLGHGAHWLVPASIPHPEIFAVLGMGALFTAIVRAPLTGIVLMVELTGQYGFMLPLLAACLTAYGIAEGLGDVPIYEALLHRSQRKAKAAAEASAQQMGEAPATG